MKEETGGFTGLWHPTAPMDKNRVLVVYYFNTDNGLRFIGGTILALNAKKNGEFTAGTLADLFTIDNNRITSERKFLNLLKENSISTRATLDERTTNLTVHRTSENKPLEEETKELLSNLLSELSSKAETIEKRLTVIQITFGNQKRNLEKSREIKLELNSRKEVAENWQKLNELLGSASGAKFKGIAQGYTLDALLQYANIQLANLTKRYRLQRIPDTLALQIEDLDMLGEKCGQNNRIK